MKRILLSLLFSCLAIVSVRADLIWYEPFNYSDGYIVDVSGGNWANHSGAATGETISGQKLVNTGSLAADVNRLLCTTDGCSYTNGVQVLYASFTVNCTTLPNSYQYFAHFKNASTIYNARVFYLPGTLPGTWRLGISGASGSAFTTYPVDLATNVDYQVVVGWNPTLNQVDQLFSYTAGLWVNPIDSSETALQSGDAVTTPPAPVAYAFRQPSSGAWVGLITNLAVATSFDEAATSVWATNAFAPTIAYQPAGGTNFEGDNIDLSVVAAGQGLQNLNYQWQKNGSDIGNPNGNANILSFFGATVSDSGSYRVIVTTPYGLSATSSVAFLWVTNPPVPPTITQQPTNTGVYRGQTAVLYCGAEGGGGGLSYLWYHNGNLVGAEGNPNVSGDGTPTLTILDVQTNNDTTGTYRCDVSNLYGTTQSSNAVVSVLSPVVTNIGYLRGLIDANLMPTNTTTYFQATGIVISKTNYTSAANSSFFMQDDTGGIDVFVGGGADIRPAAGDSVTVTGPLGQFNGLLEFNLSASNPGHSVVTNSSGNLLPPGKVLPLTFTNSVEYGGISNAFRLYQGALITFTNVYFTAADGVATFSSGTTTLTNQNGDGFTMYVYSAFTNIIGQVIPQGNIWRITGPMSFYGGPAPAGYQIEPSMFEDIVTTPPTVPSAAISVNGSGQPVLTWTAEPFTSYTILRSPVCSPNLVDYLPVASGLTFNTTAGQYTDTSAPASAFYKVISP